MITKIKNINKIITYDIDLGEVVSLDLDSIIIMDNKILSIGREDTFNSIVADKIIDAKRKTLTPGFIDSHTHLIFSSNRSSDFEQRVNGKSYKEISDSGGGIRLSVESLRNSSKEQIIQKCIKEVESFAKNGTTTIEAKSGYGLTVQDEMKSLEVIRELNLMSKIDIIPTFMGAHDFPPERMSKDDYVDIICTEMIPEIGTNKLAEFCDIFCENGYYNHSQTLKISEIAKKHNLKMKLHADEFEDSDGAYLAGELKAVSADHLMMSNLKGIRNMSMNNVVATLLPATTLFLGLHSYADGRTMIDSGCSVSLASDYNPGSNTIFPLSTIMSLACLYCGLTIKEAFIGITYNAAKAINRENSLGVIKEGYYADILFWDIDSLAEIPYWFNSQRIEMVMKNGELI